MSANRRYIPELDGLRGLAVLLVIVFHSMHVAVVTHNFIDKAMYSFAMMCWCGVDIFFVLSGFLITSILLSTKESTNYFISFYYKRLLRIFPLYYLYLLLIFLILFPAIHGKMTGDDKTKLELAQNSQVWFWLYLSNIRQFYLGKAFGAAVGHLWSLAIEEQFYLVWPCLVYFCSLRNLKRLAIFFMVFSLILRFVFYFEISPESIYSFTLTRFDTLLYGAYVAILLKDNNFTLNIKKAYRLLWSSLIILIPLFVFLGPRYEGTPIMHTIGYSFIALATASLIAILQSGQPSRLSNMFKRKWLIFFGKYSYAIYLFHVLIRQVIYRVFSQPKVFLGLQLFWDIFIILIVIAASTIAALISWHCYEKWFLKLKSRFEKNQSMVAPVS